MERGGCVYIMSNSVNSVLYIGVTSDLYSRVLEHRQKKHAESFTAKCNCNKLLYYEMFSTIEEAIGREKQMKRWRREWKDRAIGEMNPGWVDLFSDDL